MKLIRHAFELVLVGLMLLFEGVLILEEKRAAYFRRRAHPVGPANFEPVRPAPRAAPLLRRG